MSENYIGRPPGPQAFTFATQAEMEAAAALDKIVAPGMQRYGPGVAKVWARFTMANPPVNLASSGVVSITRTAAGNYTIAFTTPFSSANYCAIASSDSLGGTGNLLACTTNLAVGSVGVVSTGAGFGAPTDGGICNLVCYGDQ